MTGQPLFGILVDTMEKIGFHNPMIIGINRESERILKSLPELTTPGRKPITHLFGNEVYINNDLDDGVVLITSNTQEIELNMSN